MEGKRRMVRDEEVGDIKKGPWKVEEDQVLIHHVNKYGPRDWSSIRSKGLLRRTGKSCRLRWVNKLRPDLKTGVKFSAEEERTVIDLQAQFGNKWAKIATYLAGRTDNDVKNFWSSRQKRLARILQNSTPSSSKPHKNTKHPQTPAFHRIPSLKANTDEEIVAKTHLCSHVSHNETIEMVPFRDLVYPSPVVYDHSALPLDYVLPPERKLFPEQQLHISFPQFPLHQPEYPLLLEGQDFIGRLGAPNFLDDEFEDSSGLALGTEQVPILPSFHARGSSQVSGNSESHETVFMNSLIDDLPPIDFFDQIEPLSSPSEWS